MPINKFKTQIIILAGFAFLLSGCVNENGTKESGFHMDLITDQTAYWPAPLLNKPGYLQTVTDLTFGEGEGNFSAKGDKAAVYAIKDGRKVIFVAYVADFRSRLLNKKK